MFFNFGFHLFVVSREQSYLLLCAELVFCDLIELTIHAETLEVVGWLAGFRFLGIFYVDNHAICT